MSNSQQLWDLLKSNQLVTGKCPNESEIEIPWYIRLMQGFAGWLAAIFLLAFFAFMFGSLFRNINNSLLMAIGLLCNAAAFIIIRKDNNDFLGQFGLAVSLCGQLMFAIGLFWSFKFYELNATPFLMLSIYQVILSWLIPNFVHRYLTLVFGLCSLLIALNIFKLYGIGTAIIAIVIGFVWLREHQWAPRANFWEPIAYALATTIVIGNGALLSNKYLFHNFNAKEELSWLFEHAAQIASVLIGLVIINVVWSLLKEYKIALKSRSALLALVAAILLILISLKVSGISTGILLILLGFARQKAVLMVIGGLAVLSFFSWYYYNLELTLLVKSVYLLIMGFGFLSSWYVLPKLLASTQNSIVKPKINSLSKHKLMAVITVLVILVGINFNIKEKQQLLKDGEIVLLKLAPVDPRSIMQGDYMRLRFDIQNQIMNQQNRGTNEQGFVVVNRGENNLASFDKFHQNQPLNPNQFLIPYKIRNYRVVITTDAFYFQEGREPHFRNAEYGEFRVNKNGEALLANMVDKDFKVL